MSSVTYEVDCVEGSWGFWSFAYHYAELLRAVNEIANNPKRRIETLGTVHIRDLEVTLPLIRVARVMPSRPAIIARLPRERRFFRFSPQSPDGFSLDHKILWVGHLGHIRATEVIMENLGLAGIRKKKRDILIAAMYHDPRRPGEEEIARVQIEDFCPILSCCDAE